VLTAAEKLPAAADHDIQNDFADASPIRGAEEIVVLDMDQLRQRVNRILWEDWANGFTEVRVDTEPVRLRRKAPAAQRGHRSMPLS
jgi:hypothetical protein